MNETNKTIQTTEEILLQNLIKELEGMVQNDSMEPTTRVST